MKLAEALSVRADLQKKVARLEERLQAVAKVQEGRKKCRKICSLNCSRL